LNGESASFFAECAEPVPNIIQPRLAALIFNAIMQKCRNGEVFVAAVL
jgi:hypothetical protein